MAPKLRVVLDTNCILSSIAPSSPNGIIIDYLLKGKYNLCVTTEILMEYEEKIIEMFNQNVSSNFFTSLMVLDNVEFINIYFRLSLISADLDDNKFSDCAFASNSDYLVTNDRHFNILKTTKFPHINIITNKEFIEILKKLK